MLTRLELSGFKSFAEKTRLDFPPGVSAIVGPNGSGKSNIVDAIRWVLGEQNARSLRGDGMTDVIFNGSTTRKPMSQAEVVLVLDNQAGHFQIPLPEIRIGRRVNRSGESDYHINSKPCRLKDIKNLFVGSGAGSDSFCVIQQGQVHALLQASPKDRRSLFEEAAGISRFKLQRQETPKRLEKVNHNIGRLEDILVEVENQVQYSKIQASKSYKYQELRYQIRELRLRLCWQEWKEIQPRLLELDKERQFQTADTGEISEPEKQLAEIVLLELETTLAEQIKQNVAAKVQLENIHKSLDNDIYKKTETEKNITLSRNRLQRLLQRFRDNSDTLLQSKSELIKCKKELILAIDSYTHAELLLRNLRLEIAKINDQNIINNSLYDVANQNKSQLASDLHQKKTALSLVNQSIRTLESTVNERTELITSLETQYTKNTEAEKKAQTALSIASTEHLNASQEMDISTRKINEFKSEIQKYMLEKSEIKSRLGLLEQLEASQDGVSPGVKTLLLLKANDSKSQWNSIVGLVADMLRVRKEYATLVEIALGENVQRIIAIDKLELLQIIALRKIELPGRVGFIFPTNITNHEDNIESLQIQHSGLIARASNLVRCDHKFFYDLPDRLLGKTFIVKDLNTASDLAEKLLGHRFVTLKGEYIDENQILVLGRQPVGSGILSRKSELKDLRERLTVITNILFDIENSITTEQIINSRISSNFENTKNLMQKANSTLLGIATNLDRTQVILDSARQEKQNTEMEARRLQIEFVRLTEEVYEANQNTINIETEIEKYCLLLKASSIQVADLAAQEKSAQEQLFAIEAQINQANIEEKMLLANVNDKINQTHPLNEDISCECNQIAVELQRLQILEKSLLKTGSEYSVAITEYEKTKNSCTESEKYLREIKKSLANEAKSTAQHLEKIQQHHINKVNLERESEKLRIRMEQVYERMAEEEISDPSQIQAEPGWFLSTLDKDKTLSLIREINGQISLQGLINPNAPAELQVVENRRNGLAEQIGDLGNARKNLNETMEKLSSKATEMFLQCFEIIQENFRELFRKVFGGGSAELTLEDPASPLDTGIEVMAKPPGKDAARLSLMSGGERTMTAVALLLAVFRSRPGPFCLMDEVDAALDEANVDRFASVVKEFSEKSQFILISHHKRTMAAAKVLHGITMNEPGVSTRFSVDVEEYLREPGQRSESVFAA